ncbi:DMT family transporter [Frigidibacter mobilis]|uniref:EamA domain-containing protein n=1 Tax=Frigidibacter mobilis TaxID=1335048 RepID=A0A159Z2B6_9RHOB|nr:DMT family transporter [Frigidibacter mobilis]AMY68214.1 hypothetical protein AKL17_0955 [Frigidibacter mobilis]
MRLILLVCLAMAAFAANSVLNRLALAEGGMGPASFAAVRLAAGAVMLAALVRARSGRFCPVPAGLGRLRAFGAGTLAIYMIGFSYAYLTLQAGTGALILFGGVQVTMFAGALALREPVPLRRWVGAGLALAGIAVLAAPGMGAAPDPMGAALMAAAAVGWGLYSLAGRRAGDPLAATAGNFVLALPLALLVLLALPGGERVTGAGLAAAMVSGAVTSGLGYALWYAVLPRLAASVAAVAQLTVPVLAALAGAALLAELPGPRFWAAAALVIAGVLLSVLRVSRGPSSP